VLDPWLVLDTLDRGGKDVGDPKGGRVARPRQKRPPAFLFAVALLRPLLMLLTRRRWSGAEHLVIDGGSVVVANHTSYADPLVVAHYLNDNGIHPNFLGKVEVFQVPVIGALLKAAGQIPVYRDTGQAADAYRAAVAAVNEGRCVTIYPEATLTRDPDLWPMRGKTGAARIALQTRCPVIPVAQWGAEQIIGPYSSRLDLLPRKEVIVRAGPPVDLSDLHERGISRDVLAEATDRIMAAITALLEDLRGEQAPAERFDPRAADIPGTGNPGTGTSQKGTS
jgi:1-acyl-sn-glycerol-3-phosphate acyltransferase